MREIEYFKLNSLFLNLIFQIIRTFNLSHSIFNELIDYFFNALSFSFDTNMHSYSMYKTSLISYHNHLNFAKSFENINKDGLDSLYIYIKEKIIIY